MSSPYAHRAMGRASRLAEGAERPRPPAVKRRFEVAGGGGGERVGSARSESACGGGAAVMELLRKWLGHPEDIYHLLRFKMGGYRAVMPRMDPVSGGSGGGSGRCHLAGRGRLL